LEDGEDVFFVLEEAIGIEIIFFESDGIGIVATQRPYESIADVYDNIAVTKKCVFYYGIVERYPIFPPLTHHVAECGRLFRDAKTPKRCCLARTPFDYGIVNVPGMSGRKLEARYARLADRKK
jgi:hypothetical protein